MAEKKRPRTVIGKPAPVVRSLVKVYQYSGTKYERGRALTVYADADTVFKCIEQALRANYLGEEK